MKEERFFYHPNPLSLELPQDEARHAVRVLRLAQGDTIWLQDGMGSFYEAEITIAANHRCQYRIVSQTTPEPTWLGWLHLAMAPTKMMERNEWFVEKATEIGLNEVSFLDCAHSERRSIKTDRVERIAISAIKQSRKPCMPRVNALTAFGDFVQAPRAGQKFICHCHEQATPPPHLFNALERGSDATVLIGPEGDFSEEEVRLALQNGYRAVSLGHSRLRTETAALAAVHCMQLKNQR